MEINLTKRQLSIGEIVQMQNQLNSKADVNNPNWRQIRKKEDFLLAALLEFSELIESTPWKWWKKKPIVDYWNIKIEAIDILHFLASVLLIDGLEGQEDITIGNSLNKAKALFTSKDLDRTYALELSHKIIIGQNLVELLNELMCSIDLSAEEISAIYIAKYALNEIRWSSGYSNGSYKKNRQNGLEDNVFLQEIVEKFLNTPEQLLSNLKEIVLEKLG